MTKRVPFLDLNLKRSFAATASYLKGGDSGPIADYLIKRVIPAPICLIMKRRVEKQMETR